MQVVYEKADGVLLSLEVKWRHQLDVSMTNSALHPLARAALYAGDLFCAKK